MYAAKDSAVSSHGNHVVIVTMDLDQWPDCVGFEASDSFYGYSYSGWMSAVGRRPR